MIEFEIDVGNTYIKWRRWESGQYFSAVSGDLCALEADLDKNVVSKALVACVAGESIKSEVAGLLQSRGVKDVFWAGVVKSAVGVINGYTDYQKLGVDRWLACLAGYQLVSERCCIIDFGSAITVDVVDDGGCHKGGYIVPGSRLCFTSLGGNTGSLAGVYEYVSDDRLGLDTKECVENGVYLMQAGFLAAVLERFGKGKVICTGGGYKQFAALLSERGVVYCRDLVLDGLRLAYIDGWTGMERGE
ncbi:hypothetical protein BTA51_24150 [Hahella sp. CCB-MM4]|uniref:type III pantothenate kinase n=1 Tax=Hahella sp. (strain CCB-MM4) TaxID=1926491 RepID=UPI000B9BB21A|nr:type III pantothenate kinase [Hahella sp. CCB-MM4]OZG70927.1 hypothetical protein BTA51_24150 [Hahella sp. CCB-MM4]